jgi:hypothetical protein
MTNDCIQGHQPGTALKEAVLITEQAEDLTGTLEQDIVRIETAVADTIIMRVIMRDRDADMIRDADMMRDVALEDAILAEEMELEYLKEIQLGIILHACRVGDHMHGQYVPSNLKATLIIMEELEKPDDTEWTQQSYLQWSSLKHWKS